jgi:hypothetical protein
VRAGIRIELDKPRRLRFDLSALADVEERLGVESIEQFFDQPLNFRTIRTILWAGLVHEDPSLTEKEVGRWVDGDNYQAVYKATIEALTDAFPTGNGPPDPTTPPAGGSTGAG